ncbi:MAG: YfhO family protein [Kordia sp.]|uniref:YfhO family protein n=1 Tax=Kordia sp. TaxID=1965332 RepID=UPI00385E642A
MNLDIKKIIPHAIALLLFVAMSLAYFYPVAQGKKMQQQDIMLYTGMAKKQNDFRDQTGKELYWTDSTFGGMPTYLLGARYPHSYIKTLDRTLRFLPRPADYLFLYFLGIYVLLLVLRVNWKLAILGAIAFGFSTYTIIILDVGHNAKAHAIAYFPLVLSGILLTFQRKYVWGFLLTAVAMSLEVMAGHPQMTYYLMLLVIVIGIVYLIKSYKEQQLPHFFKTVGILSVAVILSLGVNGASLMTTKQYADWSIRGKSELTKKPDGSQRKQEGLSKDYITQYSYGKTESFNLLIPRFMGGANSEDFGVESNTFTFLRQNGYSVTEASEAVKTLPGYWGSQPIVAAPAYVGAVIIFLALLALFFVRSRAKWWLVGGILMSLLLSWGKNFNFLTDFMIDYFPFYNKFRAVSSIQVILELCIPILGILGLAQLFRKESKISLEKKQKALYISTGIIGGIILFFLLFKSTLFNFESPDDKGMNEMFLRILKEDRAAAFTQDAIRSLLLVLATAGVLYAFLKEKIKENIVILVLGGLLLFDLVGVAQRYVYDDENRYVTKSEFENPYDKYRVDEEILKDKGHYRVFEPRLRLAHARTAYFHNTLGGYHAAKPRHLEELYNFYLDYNRRFEFNAKNVSILNMLNVKYTIDERRDEQGRTVGLVNIRNPYPNGNAWFIKKVNFVETADDEIISLQGLKTKEEVLFRKGQENAKNIKGFYGKDSLSTITLTKYKPDQLTYTSENSELGFAVFSEIHYPHGWNVYLDGKLVPYYRVNYLLRGMEVPAGKHKIEFKFEPEIVKTGVAVSLTSSIILMLLIFGGIFYEFRRKKKVEAA